MTVKYILWIGITFSLLMAAVGSDPLWPAILCAGIIANGLVVGLNGWKMPVKGRIEESVRHAPMTPATRLKLLGDIIPTGFGLASVGDVLLAAGMLGIWANRGHIGYAAVVATLAYGLWVGGWSRGVKLLEKWTPEERQDSKKNIPIVIVLMLLGNLLGMHGCSVSDFRASAKEVESAATSAPLTPVKVKSPAKWRSLGNILAPPPKVLTRLREETAKTRKRNQEVVQAAIDGAMPRIANTSFLIQSVNLKRRTGPFCRVTCAAHHGGQYDVETLPEACRANWIPPTAAWVPGWIDVDATHESTTGWPGPAYTEFHSYKLYWSDVQGGAKVISRSQEPK